MNSAHSVVYDGVVLGANAVIEPFCIIGTPPKGYAVGDLKTIIGADVVLRSHVVIYAGNQIGTHFHAGHKANIREFNRIGDNVSIGTLSVVEHHVIIGDRVRIHSQVFVPEYCILEDECWVGPNVVFTNARYPGSRDAKKHLSGVIVGKKARIGANATLLPGVVIGEQALVGAGAVVTRDVPLGAVVVGNPAKIINRISQLPYNEA